MLEYLKESFWAMYDATEFLQEIDSFISDYRFRFHLRRWKRKQNWATPEKVAEVIRNSGGKFGRMFGVSMHISDISERRWMRRLRE